MAGRYVFTPEILDCIAQTPPGKNSEIQLTDAMRRLMQNRAIYGLKLNGVRYDIGNKLDYLKTNVIYGMQNREFGADFREFIQQMAQRV